MTVLVVVQTVLLVVLTVLVAGLLRAYGAVLARLHRLDGGGLDGDGLDGDGLDGGTGAGATVGRSFDLLPLVDAARPRDTAGPAHDIAGETLTGELVAARVREVEHDTVLLFLSSGCPTCATFWDELADPALHPPAPTRLLVVAQDAAAESLPDLRALAPPRVDVVLSSAAWEGYGVPGSPHVVYVHGPSGTIRGEGTGQSLRQVATLLARASGDLTLVGGTARDPRKPDRDAAQEAAVDRELLAAGIVPGDARLYASDAGPSADSDTRFVAGQR